MPKDTTAEAITAAWRAESARLVGALTRMTRDVELAEDLAQDSLLAALEQWPVTGVPTNPAAWLMTTAKRRSIDHLRRAENLRRKTEELAHAQILGEEEQMPDLDAQVDYIEDDVLRLIFLSCHPSLSPESRAALTLRLVGGLTTSEIARGFLATESTMGQRISRAKKTLIEALAFARRVKSDGGRGVSTGHVGRTSGCGRDETRDIEEVFSGGPPGSAG